MVEAVLFAIAFVFITLVSPAIGIAMSLFACVSGLLPDLSTWMHAAHHAQATVHLAQFI